MGVDSYHPARCTSEFVRKQLQNTIHGRQKPAGGKDLSGGTAQKSRLNREKEKNNLSISFFQVMNSSNLDSSKLKIIPENKSFAFSLDQKGAYFRNQLSSQTSAPPVQTNIRSQQQQQQQQSKTTM